MQTHSDICNGWLPKTFTDWKVIIVAVLVNKAKLLQVTALMESFVTLGAFLRQLSKSGVFAPGVLRSALLYDFLTHSALHKYLSCENIIETDDNVMNHMQDHIL